MIPSQISYTPSQGAYYIPGQVRAMLWTLLGGGSGGGVHWDGHRWEVLPGLGVRVCFGMVEGVLRL